MDKKEIGRNISEVSDDEFWKIVSEEAKICDTETVNAAKAELERRSMKKSNSEPQESESSLAACPKCGTVLKPDELFCPECGWKLPVREPAEQQSMEMNFCPECGAKLKAGQSFCASCGARVLPDDAETEMRVSSTAYRPLRGPAKATGGLRVWLWISIIACIVSVVYYVVGTNLTIGTLNAIGIESGVDGIYKATMCCGLVLAAAVIYGDYRLLNGYKNGFYIICICTIISLIVFLVLNINAFRILNKSMQAIGIYSPSYDGTSMISSFIIELVAAAGSIGILWLFLRKQWANFR